MFSLLCLFTFVRICKVFWNVSCSRSFFRLDIWHTYFGKLVLSRMGHIFSLHIRSMWETICDAQASFWLNSKFLSKFSRKRWPKFTLETPPPSPFRKTSDLRWPKFTPEYPPPFWKTSDLRWPKFTPEYPPPPILENLRFEMTKVYSRIHPPSPFWKTSDLRWPKFTPEYPPPLPFRKMREIVCGD